MWFYYIITNLEWKTYEARFRNTHDTIFVSNLSYNDLLKVYPLTQLNLADELAKLKGNIQLSKGSLKDLFNESLWKM